jgi:hypothetical protein
MTGQEERKSKLGPAIKLTFLCLCLLAIPVAAREAELDKEVLTWVARVCVGLVVLVLLVGLFKHSLRILAVLIALLALVIILATEGVIEAPRLMELLGKLRG